jgi:hypothetical protein
MLYKAMQELFLGHILLLKDQNYIDVSARAVNI